MKMNWKKNVVWGLALLVGAMFAGAEAKADGIDPMREVVFKVNGLTCPAVEGLGCGHRIAPVLAQLHKIEGVEKSSTNLTGTMLRVSVTLSADRDKVAEAVREALAKNNRNPVLVVDDELKQALTSEQWHSPEELSSIEFRTLAVRRLKASADANGKTKDIPQLLYYVSIEGMTCESCAARARAALATVPAVSKADVDYKGGDALVVAKSPARSARGTTSSGVAHQLAAAIEQAGFQPTINYVLTIQGMTCDACAKSVEQALAAVPGASVVKVNLKEACAAVRPSTEADDLSQSLIAAVELAGYQAAVHTAPEPPKDSPQRRNARP